MTGAVKAINGYLQVAFVVVYLRALTLQIILSLRGIHNFFEDNNYFYKGSCAQFPVIFQTAKESSQRKRPTR